MYTLRLISFSFSLKAEEESKYGGHGGGGGRPNMAQAGGKNPAGITDALSTAKTVLESQIK